MLRSRILTGFVLAVVAGVFAAQVASCTLDQAGTKPPVVTGAPCTADANCDDGNPCTTEICPTATLVCEYTTQATGAAPTAAQTPEDCKTIICTDGEPSTEDDSQDSHNDNNSCTTDACTAGVPTNEVLADGVSCKQGVKTGTCTAGTCTISCMNNNDCNDENTCSDDLCNTSTSTCVYTNLDGIPTPGAIPVVGDCKLQFCENGIDKVVNDDSDVNEDNNPCTFDVCNAGVPQNNNVPDATACTPGDVKVCDGNGACVACTAPSHCVGITETECEKRSCVNNTCQIAYEGQTTLASPVLQVARDCNKVVCNGANGTTTVPDDADLPDDSNPCTKDQCAGGVVSNPPEALNFNCGASQVCDGTGKCVGCTTAGQCMGTDDFCKTRTCITNVCGFSYTPNGTDLPTGQTGGDCKVLECDGAGNVKTSPLTSDLPVDGNACTQDLCSGQGNPSNPATAINSPCSVGVNTACDGNGTCKKSQGTICGAGTECVTANCVDGVCCNNTCTTLCRSCNVAGSAGTCTDVPKGQDDANCSGATQSCNGPNDCDDENGQPCATNDACLSNICADNVCCNNICNTACKSCSVAGSEGTCSNLPAMSQDNSPTNICTGMSQCDGTGICKKVIGAICSVAADCLSGNCIDGVCCTDMCTAECKACNVMNFEGTCSNVPLNTDDGTCSGAAVSCDGAGVCKTVTGQACPAAGAAGCFSGNCVDGFCCNNACMGLCQACSNAKTGMTNGTCSPVTAGTDLDNDCADAPPCGTNGLCDGSNACQKYPIGTVCAPQSCTGSTQTNADTCNAAGACFDNMTTNCAPYTCGTTGCKTSCTVDGDCVGGKVCIAMACTDKQANGGMCTGPTQCTSGNCVDGYCCNSSCGTQCMDCDVAGFLGICTNTPRYTNDGCPANQTCNGGIVGMPDCDLVNGQTCSSAGQCASNNCATTCQP